MHVLQPTHRTNTTTRHYSLSYSTHMHGTLGAEDKVRIRPLTTIFRLTTRPRSNEAAQN